jgi:hypothetical protein
MTRYKRRAKPRMPTQWYVDFCTLFCELRFTSDFCVLSNCIAFVLQGDMDADMDGDMGDAHDEF